MHQTLRAVYRGGAFFPETRCDLPEGAEVELTVGGPILLPPTITDADERRRVLKELTATMRKQPIPRESPRFSRDDLHERR